MRAEVGRFRVLVRHRRLAFKKRKGLVCRRHHEITLIVSAQGGTVERNQRGLVHHIVWFRGFLFLSA